MFEKEVYVFFSSVIVGVILAVIFDFFRLMRRKGNTSNIIVYLQDILYWIIVAFVVVASAFITNDGALRGYMFVGYILGAIIYLISISKLILKFLGAILDFIEKVFNKFFGFLGKGCGKICGSSKKAFENLGEKMKLRKKMQK